MVQLELSVTEKSTSLVDWLARVCVPEFYFWGARNDKRSLNSPGLVSTLGARVNMKDATN
jgi:hypothetical protein